jgi:S-formylglutathione hydrolase
MGGFAAIKIALTRPDLFVFAGSFSPSIEATHRKFSVFRIGEWFRFRKIFGPWGSSTRKSRDPFLLVSTADTSMTPFIYLTAGENEPLLVPDRSFASRLNERRFSYEFHTKPGGHAWNQWDSQLPGCFDSLFRHIAPSS